MLEACVKDFEVTLGFKGITLNRVWYLFWGKMLEMHRLPAERSNACCRKHKPGQCLSTQRRGFYRKKFSGFLRQVQQDGIAVEDGRIAINDRWYLSIGVNSEIIGAKL